MTIDEAKKICACIPFADADAGLTETQDAMRTLITAVELLADEAKAARRLLCLDAEWQDKQPCPTADCWMLNIEASQIDDANYSAARAKCDSHPFASKAVQP